MNPLVPVRELKSEKLVELLGAGLRPGRIGHYDSQELLDEVRRRLDKVLPIPDRFVSTLPQEMNLRG